MGEDRIDTPPPAAEQFDSEHLWPVVRAQLAPGRRVLVVRGTSGAAEGDPSGQGRDWLIEQCRAAGAEVEACVAYRRERLPPGEADRERLRAASGPATVWLFSSSEAVQALQGHWTAGARAVALATHPRIAEAARALGFTRVIRCRPTLADVGRGLESWASASP